MISEVMGVLNVAFQGTVIAAHVKAPRTWTAHHPRDSILRPSQIGTAGPAEASKMVFRGYVIGGKMTDRTVTVVLGRWVVTWQRRPVSAHCRTGRMGMAVKTVMTRYLEPDVQHPSLAWLR